jgi:putative alpha-1,2-mannosidase
MKRYLFFLLAIILYIGDIHSQDLRQTYINTFVGTAASTTKTAGLFGKHSEEYGQTLPAVLVPHGMNFWTAQTEDTEQKCIAPYYYKDGKIQGFRNSHWIVGGCTQDYGSMTLMTVTGSLKTAPEERASTFSHGREISSPSYYSVYLDDDNVLAEMTAQSRSGDFPFHIRQGRYGISHRQSQ